MPSPSTSARGVRALIAVASVAAVGVSAPAAIAASPNADTASKKTLRLATPDKKPAIVNGQQIPITQVPYQVFVQATTGGGTYSCGGSIYDADTIVTAAHCVIDSSTRAEFSPAQMTVRAGVTDTNLPADPTEQTSGVTDIIVHPYYDYGTNGVAPDDVALLELDTPLDLTGPAAQPISLTAGAALPTTGTAGYISGYGRQVAGGTPNGLLYGLDTAVGDPLACGGDATAVVLCLQAPTGSACEGDSGGPLAVTGALVGVASFVTLNGPTGECGINSVNGYVNIAAPEVKQFVENPTVLPPRAPRGGEGVSASGVFRAGSSMTCTPGAWTEAPAFTFTFTDTRNGEVLQSGTSATYAFKDSDVGRTVDCRVEASNAGGTGITRTQSSPAIGPNPTPPPPPPPAPRPAPTPTPTPTPTPRRPQPRRPAPRRTARRADVRVSVNAASSRGRSGATMRYTIRVVNRGTVTGRRVAVCIDPGRGLAFATLPRGARRAAGEACLLVGTMRAKSSRTYRMTLRIARTSSTRVLTTRVAVAAANGPARVSSSRIRVQGVQSRTTPPAVTG